MLTTSATTGKIAWLIRTPNNAVIVPSDVQYVYNAPVTTYTASLGRTIHGGSVDVVNGSGTDENDNLFTFDPVPIDSKLGDNNFYSDCGDTSVTYRQDIDLALGGN